MSPTVFRERGYRFYFFSREEPRMHVHVACADGEAKFWLEPQIELAENRALTTQQLGTILSLLHEHEEQIKAAWKEHFGG